MIRSLWRFRGLIGSLVRRELQVRSLRALWGNAWLVIQPALQILLYTLVFSKILAAKLPGVDGGAERGGMVYAFYLCTGLLTWNYFAEIVGRCQTLFLEHAHLMKAVRFPRSVLPLAMLTGSTLNFALVFLVFLGVLYVSGHWPGMALLGFLPLLGVQALLALGLGIFCGTLNVFYRDVGHTTSIVLQFWFWLTPIVYPIAIVPEQFREIIGYNPMASLVAGYQAIVIDGVLPMWQDYAVVTGIAVLFCLSSWLAFRWLSSDMVDEL